MKQTGLRTSLLTAATCLVGASLVASLPAHAANPPSNTHCQLQSQGAAIKHIVHIQFDNVHLRRDNPNVPSDLEQMPNLLNFLENNGTLLTNHRTPLISHTAVDILTTLTGVYGDKFGVPIGNSLRYFNPDGSSTGMGSFAYWTDPLDSFSNAPTDTTPQMIDRQGKTHPAPWVTFTRAGCDVGAFSVANIELENIGLDITTVFGANSPEAMEAKSNPDKAVADFEGIAVHCAQNSPICAQNAKPDLLPQESGGYVGFNALFGNKNVAPQISSQPIKDLDGNPIQDDKGNPGFPGFDPSASQTLGYLATKLEAGVPVVYGYIADAHDNHVLDVAFGPGQVGYVQQLAAYDRAFGQFFTRLQKDHITPDNTLFIVTADENDQFVGGPPSPADCDGVNVSCSYSQIGEIDGDLSRLLATQRGNTTPFAVHADSAPTFYVTGNPAQADPAVRQLERDVAALTAVNPITLQTDLLTAALADHAEQSLLHMVTDDPNRTPTFNLFANDNYFLFSSGKTTNCGLPPACIQEQPGFAWNHGDFQNQITKTWLGMVGPGIQHLGSTDMLFSDHTDIRPTMLSLVGLADDYTHDGRVLFEVIEDQALPHSLRLSRDTLSDLAAAYKQINAPRGELGRVTLGLSTAALRGTDPVYATLEAEINGVAAQRDAIASQMIGMLEAAAFNDVPIDAPTANLLIEQAANLLESVE